MATTLGKWKQNEKNLWSVFFSLKDVQGMGEKNHPILITSLTIKSVNRQRPSPINALLSPSLLSNHLKRPSNL